MMMTVMINMIAITIILNYCIIASLLLLVSSWPLHVFICVMTTIIMSNNWDDKWTFYSIQRMCLLLCVIQQHAYGMYSDTALFQFQKHTHVKMQNQY